MRIQDQRGQTGIAVSALVVALVALGISIYTYLQGNQRDDLQTELNKMQELVEQGRQEMANALKRLEEQIRGNDPQAPPPRQQ